MTHTQLDDIIESINNLQGNQAKVALLWLSRKSVFNPMLQGDIRKLKKAIEVAKDFHPDSPIESFEKGNRHDNKR